MIGRDLRVIREACGVTMGELAKVPGMRVSFISDVERGVRDIEVDLYVAALARVVRGHRPEVALPTGDPTPEAHPGGPVTRRFFREYGWAILTTVGSIACWQDAAAGRDLHRAWMAGFLACWSMSEIWKRRA